MSVLYIYYWILILALMLPFANANKFKSLEILYVLILPVSYLSAVLVFRDYNNSNDFQNYLYIYSEVVSFDDVFSRNGEFVFNIFLILGNAMGVSYEVVYTTLILISILALCVILYFSKIKFNDKLVLILLVVSSSGTYFLLANAFRQGLALTLLLAALVAANSRLRLIALCVAPLLHFSSLFPIFSIMIRRISSYKYSLLFLVMGFLLIIPIIQSLVIYRFEKYVEYYEYESSFQYLRIVIDIIILIILLVAREKFTNVLSPIIFFATKILVYELSPLIYSRVSYYDVVICCYIYLNCRVKDDRRIKILIILGSILYANLIFSVESLNSNFSLIKNLM